MRLIHYFVHLEPSKIHRNAFSSSSLCFITIWMKNVFVKALSLVRFYVMSCCIAHLMIKPGKGDINLCIYGGKYAETYSQEMHKENIIKLCYYENVSQIC